MKFAQRFRVAGALFCLLAQQSSRSMHAQSASTAQLAGNVVDANGASVVAATVKLINAEHNNVHLATTDEHGHYLLVNLEIAPYRLEVVKDGFKPLVQKAIVLHVGDNRKIDVHLLSGSRGEPVEVTLGANLIQTEQTAVSQIISRKSILELPLNGRQPTQLVLISGASVVAPTGDLSGSKNYPTSTTISIAGGQPSGTNFLLDGGTNVDTFSNINLPLPFPDALQEFGVDTSVLPARNGYLSGGLVTIITKSGANDFHGNLFEFVRNGIFNAQNRFSVLPDALKRNQFGGTFGGHVVRDKLFFFGGYQDTRLVAQPGNSFAYVPTARELAGDFSVAESAACQSSGRAHAPLRGYATNQIPTANFDQAAVKLTQYLPSTADPCGKASFGIKSVQNEAQYIGRVDWNQGQRHTAYARYFNAASLIPPPFSASNITVTTSPGIQEMVNAATVGDYFNFSPRLLNAFHATVNRRGETRSGSTSIINAASLGSNVYTPIKDDLHVTVTGDFSAGCGTCSPSQYGVTTFELADDLDYLKAAHHFGFGISALRTDMNVIGGYDGDGLFGFNGAVTGDAMADFLLGGLSSFSQSKLVVQAARRTVLAPYAQDTVRLSQRLTLTAGVRWEPHFFPTDVQNRGSLFSRANFDANVHSTVNPGAPAGALYYGDPGISRSFTATNWKNISPRVGIAWDPTGKGRETLRGAFGLMYDAGGMFELARLIYNPPGVDEIDLGTSNPGGFSDPWNTGYHYPGGNPFPITTSVYPLNVSWLTLPQTLHTTAMKQYNLTYQRQVGNDWVFSASYLGNRTEHVWAGVETNPALNTAAVCAQFATGCTTANTTQRRVLNQANPANGKYYGSVVSLDDQGTASYNGLLISANHRLTKGISVLANYTYSHCIGEFDQSSSSISTEGYQNPVNIAGDQGNCADDLRHIVNASVVETVRLPGDGFFSKAVGGWQFAPLVRATSGIPLNVVSGADNSRTGLGLDRPNLNGNASPYASTGNKLQYLNAAAFTQNPVTTFGTLGRDAFHGPNYLTIDLGVARQFLIRKRYGVEFRCDTFNVINKVNLIAPATGTGIPGISTAGINLNLSSATFGQITSSGDPRIIQLAMKTSF